MCAGFMRAGVASLRFAMPWARPAVRGCTFAGVAVNARGQVLVADFGNHRCVIVAPASIWQSFNCPLNASSVTACL